MEDIIRALLDVVRAQHAAAQETEEAPFDMNDIVDMAMNIVGRPDESEEEEEMKGETIFTERLDDNAMGYLTLMPPKRGRDFERHLWRNFNVGALLGSNEWATEHGVADNGSYTLFRIHKGLPCQPWAPEVLEDKGELKTRLLNAWLTLEDGLNEGARLQAEERGEESVVFTKADFDIWWDIREKAGWWDKKIKEAKEELVERA